ncbi:MAG: hypothetical protein JSR94_19145 [Proteobacteria bacterium]|nr:hypothetical protein [Pseudomonadota bacterium]HMW41219.1 hypothetical protein [Plasticicumulans sp.]HNF65283.1 hypothetical protein [Plasticicumulans sp.]
MNRMLVSDRPGALALLGLMWFLPVLVASAKDATDAWPGEWTFNGFLSQGYSLSNTNRFNSSNQQGGSFDLREAAVNTRWQVNDRLSMAAQLLYRDVPVANDDGVRLDYGFIDYSQAAVSGNQNYGVTIGRFKNPFGFFNETRDVPFTRPGVLLPQSLYTERGRPFAMASQGVLAHADFFTDTGTLALKASFGEPIPGGASLEYILFGNDLSGQFDPDKAVTAQVRYDGAGNTEGWSAALSYLYYSYDFSRPRSLGRDAFNFSFRVMAASLQYSTPDWRITSEAGYGQAFDNIDRFSAYLQGAYRLSPTLESFLRYDLMIVDVEDRWGHEYERQGRGPAHNRYAKDLTFGINWDLSPDLTVRAEWHHVEGTGWLSPAEANLRETDRRWNLGMLELSFRF